MRRAGAALTGLIAALLFAAPAQAVPPALGPPSATNIQGVSALLVGTVDPEGLSTTYRFQYVDDASFKASGFAGAAQTPATSAGSGSASRPARAAISGPTSSTTYHYRLLATNASGTTTGRARPSPPPRASASCRATKASRSACIADGGGACLRGGLPPLPADLALSLARAASSRASRGRRSPTATCATCESRCRRG